MISFGLKTSNRVDAGSSKSDLMPFKAQGIYNFPQKRNKEKCLYLRSGLDTELTKIGTLFT